MSLVQGVSVDVIFDAVVKYGKVQWFQIGLKLGLVAADLTVLAADKPSPAGKLRAVLESSRAAVGTVQLAEKLLSICDDLDEPIYNAVAEEVKRKTGRNLGAAAAAVDAAPQTSDAGGLVEGVHPRFIIEAVLEYGSSRWSALGLKLCPNNQSKVRCYTKGVDEDVDKLEAIILKRRAAIGEEKVAEDILQACKDIKDPIYADVIGEARRLHAQFKC